MIARSIVLCCIATCAPPATLGQTMGAVQWLTHPAAHSVKDPQYFTDYGPYYMAPYVYKFDYVYNPIIGRKDGYFGYRYDPDGGEPAMVKPLAVGIVEEKGRIIDVVPLKDRFLVAYYRLEAKDEVAELWAQHYDPKDLEPMGEAVRLGAIEFKDKIPWSFMPLLRMSPDRKRMMIYYDQIKDREKGDLMMCWVFDATLNGLWNSAYTRPGYMLNTTDDWNRTVTLANDGSVLVVMRPLKEGTGLYTNVTDPDKITDQKLYRLKGSDMQVTDLAIRSIKVRNPVLMPSDSGIFLSALVPKSKSPAGGGDRMLFMVSDSLALVPVFKLKGTAGETDMLMSPRKAGGWHVVSMASTGLEVIRCDGRGKVAWTSKFPRWQAGLEQVVDYGEDVIVIAGVQKGALKDFAKGKPLALRGNSYLRVPVFLRCTGKNQATMGAIIDADEGERDILKRGFPVYYDVESSRMLMESSFDSKRPGVMAVRIP